MHRTEGISRDSWLFRGTMPGLYNTTEQRAPPGTAGFSNGQCLVCTSLQNRGHIQGRSFLGAKSGLNNTNTEQGTSPRTDGLSTEMTAELSVGRMLQGTAVMSTSYKNHYIEKYGHFHRQSISHGHFHNQPLTLTVNQPKSLGQSTKQMTVNQQQMTVN